MSQEAKLLRFITRLPPTVNPYVATAKRLEEMIHSPQSPLWSRRLRVVVLVLYCLIFAQALYLLYQRSRIHKSAKLKYNRLGLFVINISDTSALAYFFYAPLTLYVVAVNIAIDRGYPIDESTMICVFGHKFIAVVLGSWGTRTQCAQIFWNSDMASNMDREKLKTAIKWGVSSFFVICAFGPVPFISLIYIRAYRELHEVETIIHGVASNLRAESGTYDPATFNVLNILTLLIPARRATYHNHRFEVTLKTGDGVYCLITFLLISIYIPLLTISLRSLYNQSVSQSKIDAVMGSSGGSKPSRNGRKIYRERQRLVYHALCVFFSTAVHFPPTVWKVFNSKGDFLHDVAFKEVTQQGLMAPLAFSGNVILLLLNIHSYQIRRDRKMRMAQRQATIESSQGSGAPTRRTGIRTLFLSQSDDEEISLQNVVESTQVGSHMAEKSEKYPGSPTLTPGYMSTSLAGIKIKQCTFSTTT
ncbi:hypothetical protein PTTG_28204 [Puccinia triticina 1-1 BBBD Race 1]|uniref:G-protein coupled receptors family 1 profile domain-containing protein n=2 Tax=Puccinia triticina TaxID=208348 RepID=A0A180GE24_PUCT1|nr:uncharacterized protein PtA15_18A363 [Puccinia triticina]OAV90789.1 hypothetical protein PTTG_28204 [Puccinia triticina 1-1 BBBD Race 1]WAQ93303.1 hypothetical protein PtA15_18A363 [Puccinia triticina]WAR63293.1 hypothetical protein PtB15_18B376 [Puccinia triticina]